MKLPLFDYQEKTVEFALKNPYSILALEMGLGKSACALAVKERLGNQRCLIVCPAYLTKNWEKEIRKFLDGQIISLFKKGSEIYFPFDSDFAIISYDLAMKAEVLFEWATMVVFDEPTEIKSMKAKRTQAMHRLVYENSVPRVHLLSGTIIKNRVEEFYSPIALCNYNPSLKEETEFLKRFTNSIDFADHFSNRQEFDLERGGKWVKVIKWEGIKNEDELREYLRGIYISIKSKMPPINYKNIHVEELNEINEELRSEFEDFKNGTSLVAPQVKAKAALLKAPHTVQYIRHLKGTHDGPVIVYTDHVQSCKFIAEAFGVPAITGELTPTQRFKIANEFQDGKYDFLVATIKSLSMGTTLTVSNLIVFNDLPWVGGDIAQCEFRINRISQLKPCHVHRIFCCEQDEYIFEEVLKKSAIINRF